MNTIYSKAAHVRSNVTCNDHHAAFTRKQRISSCVRWAPHRHPRSTGQVACSAVDPFKSSPAAAAPKQTSTPSTDASQWGYTTHKWNWRGHSINYATAGCGKPIVLVHGFGASVGHYRKNIAVLSKTHKVYAIDLLGFGASDKPDLPGGYNMELWRDQIVAFIEEFLDQPAVLVGNSIGSLASLMASAELCSRGQLAGVALLNTSGAMNNKGVLGDIRIILVYPLFLLIDFLLSIKPLARKLFDGFRSRDNIRTVLQGVYMNQGAVDDELVDIIYGPSEDQGALDVFVSVISGPPGPKPWDLIPRIKAPLLVLWGDKDTFTPIDGPVGKFMQQLPASRPDTKFVMLPDVGHCPHDDRPELVHAELLPWLDSLPAPAQKPAAA